MLIDRLALKNLLSFRDSVVELGRLNVLIGPNAVGKSNLIEAIGLLQATPSGFGNAILRGGGASQWICLGEPIVSDVASIECRLNLIRGPHVGSVSYFLQFSADSSGLPVIRRERVVDPESGGIYLKREGTQAELGPVPRQEAMNLPAATESVLAQFKNPADPTPITEIGNHFSQIRIFREFRTGPQSGARNGVSTNAQKTSLADGGDNLALMLHELDFLDVHGCIKDYLRRFCDRFQDVKVSVGEGTVRTFLRETGLSQMLSAIRMSDGTLKFLSLLVALFHPSPPPLMCIEEPELGLHPDALPLVAEALMEASESVQLIVTTHSDALVDALSDRPETVLVCERDFDSGTQMKRLSRDDLKEWREHYTLGQLWRKGEIGGGRW